MVKFLDIQKITQKYENEIHRSVSRIIDSGWYLLGQETAEFEKNYAQRIVLALPMGWMHCALSCVLT